LKTDSVRKTKGSVNHTEESTTTTTTTTTTKFIVACYNSTKNHLQAKTDKKQIKINLTFMHKEEN
jgi:hypothetical protein